MNEQFAILEGYGEREKTAYLTAIASIASADRQASQEEGQFLQAFAQGAQLSEASTQQVLAAAQSTDETHLQQSLDVLKSSELRFSLLSDVIAFAEADGNYGQEEKQRIEQMAQYLGINPEQKQALTDFTHQAQQKAQGIMQDEQAQQNFSPNNFLGSLGIGDKLQKAGINGSSLIKGALGIIGPLLLMNAFKRGAGSGSLLGGILGGGMLASALGKGGGGGLGGMLGGLLGGNQGGGMAPQSSGGGLGGLLGGLGGGGGLLGGLLGGGRGFSSGAGGMLGRIFGR